MPELSRRLLGMSKVRNGWMTIKNVSGLLYDYRENMGLPVAVMFLGKV